MMATAATTVTNMRLLACYGSLKWGFHNHDVLGDKPRLKGIGSVDGVMTLCSNYPKLFESDSETQEFVSKHNIEIYEVSDDIWEEVHMLEVGAGYYPKQIDTQYGKATIYYYPWKFRADTEPIISEYSLKIVRQLFNSNYMLSKD